MTLLSPLACAGTALEEQVIRAPMPHTLLAKGGPVVKAHYVRLHSGVKESKMDQATAAQLKSLVQACVQVKQKLGVRASLPREFPKLDLGFNKDSYAAHNRVITYMRQYTAQVNEDDCSLREVEGYTAELDSSAGSCTIDLVARTIEGQCDVKAHAAAAPMVRMASKSAQQKQFAEMAADPRTAAAAASLQKMMGAVPSARPTKRVLGIECEVVRGADDNTICIAIGGSFQSALDLILESRQPGLGAGKAVQARLDAPISAAVFAPHAAGGFTVRREESQ